MERNDPNPNPNKRIAQLAEQITRGEMAFPEALDQCEQAMLVAAIRRNRQMQFLRFLAEVIAADIDREPRNP